VFHAYQDLGRRDRLHSAALARTATAFGTPQTDIDGLARRLVDAVAHAAPLEAAAIAATLAGQAVGKGNAGELFALWVADAALAAKLGWARAVPLLSAELLQRRGAARRPRPGEPDWSPAAALAAANAAVRAVDLAHEVARRAAKLEAVAPQVRTKQAGQVVDVLLRQDAVTAAQVREILSDRAARRLLDRLKELGGVRELSGRPVFRIYGL
jgi:hypothetical protein